MIEHEPLGAGPFHELISTGQRVQGLTDAQLAEGAGLSTKTLELMKSGRMMVPITKIASFARLLKLPANELLLLYLAQRAPEYLQAMEECGLWVPDRSRTCNPQSCA